MKEIDNNSEEGCCICGRTSVDLYECERCGELFCDDCQATYDQFTQIDYNCCKHCSETNPDYD